MADFLKSYEVYKQEERGRPTAGEVSKNFKFDEESVGNLDCSYEVSKSLDLPLPSENMRAGFITKCEREEKETFTFQYRVRESFRELVDKVLLFFDGNQDRYHTLRYTGNVGTGKSYNLAALTHYLRALPAFNLSVVYISSCAQLFENYISNMQIALSETFPDERATISHLGNHRVLSKFIDGKRNISIVFIFDDWSYLEQDAKLRAAGNNQAERLDSRRKLLELSSEQYRIEAISAGNGNKGLIMDSKANLEPNDLSSLDLFGGLTKLEWPAWKQSSWLFRGISDEEEDMVIDITGLIPLYLKALESYPAGDLYERLCSLDRDMGPVIANSLQRSSVACCAESQCRRLVEIFITQMTASLNESSPPHRINYTLYDHHYFSRDLTHNIVRPISGLVRRRMRDYLDKHYPEQFRRRITTNWVEAALRSDDPSLRGFAFEEFALLQLLRYPHTYLVRAEGEVEGAEVERRGRRSGGQGTESGEEGRGTGGVPQGTECNLVRFPGDYPEESLLNTEGLTMFWPINKFNRSHIDAVLRYVHPPMPPPSSHRDRDRGGGGSTTTTSTSRASMVSLYGVRVTLRSPEELQNQSKRSFDFFLRGVGMSEKYLRPQETETAKRYLVWITNAPVPDRLHTQIPQRPPPPPRYTSNASAPASDASSASSSSSSSSTTTTYSSTSSSSSSSTSSASPSPSSSPSSSHPTVSSSPCDPRYFAFDQRVEFVSLRT